jgi:hypothetical protein
MLEPGSLLIRSHREDQKTHRFLQSKKVNLYSLNALKRAIELCFDKREG